MFHSSISAFLRLHKRRWAVERSQSESSVSASEFRFIGIDESTAKMGFKASSRRRKSKYARGVARYVSYAKGNTKLPLKAEV